jgi:sugar phosphate isomerase/epimerase
MDISLQLYSIKEEAEADFAGALALTEKAGYQGVEFAGYFGNTPDQLAELLKKYHLKAVSSHVSLDRLKENFEEELGYPKTLGFNMIVCPYSTCKTREEVLDTAEFLQSCAQRAAKAGIVIGYHNHAHEIVKIDGRYALDLLLEKAPAFQYQPDVFWIAYAGVDPAAYIKPYAAAGRICTVHAKDLAKDGDEKKTPRSNVYVGQGKIDFPAIAALCPPAKYPYIIEQEDFTTDHFDGISQSYMGLRKILAG